MRTLVSITQDGTVELVDDETVPRVAVDVGQPVALFERHQPLTLLAALSAAVIGVDVLASRHVDGQHGGTPRCRLLIVVVVPAGRHLDLAVG